MTSSTEHTPALSTPSVQTLGLMLVSGLAATVAFDLWGQVISPSLGLATLSPHGLAKSLLGSLGLPDSGYAGYFMHFYVVGLIGYPIGWLLVFRPLWSRVAGDAGGWIVPAALYGVALWVVAIGGITTLAGLPTFLNFTGITWVALAGHVIYGLVLGAVTHMAAGR